jgi:hypothetical protein
VRVRSVFRELLNRVVSLAALAGGVVLSACSSSPLVPYSTDTPPLMLAPASATPLIDQRGRFREILCAVLGTHHDVPDWRPCEDALTRVGSEPAGNGRPVDLEPSRRHLIAAVVPGVGFGCIEAWLEPAGTVTQHLRQQGYDGMFIKVDALSSSTNNARQIRDALMAMPAEPGPARLVLFGYSKGAPDILEALVLYPEIRSRVAALVSIAGAVGGSPLANDAKQSQADLLRHFPRAHCERGDDGAVASLRPAVRRAWLAANPLPKDVHYYSVATFPRPERISSILKSSHRKLAHVDPRNDSQLIFYDELIPGSGLLGYLNADHWAVAVPIARSHRTIGSTLVTENAYPREALVEAVLRFIEEDLSGDPQDR